MKPNNIIIWFPSALLQVPRAPTWRTRTAAARRPRWATARPGAPCPPPPSTPRPSSAPSPATTTASSTPSSEPTPSNTWGTRSSRRRKRTEIWGVLMWWWIGRWAVVLRERTVVWRRRARRWRMRTSTGRRSCTRRRGNCSRCRRIWLTGSIRLLVSSERYMLMGRTCKTRRLKFFLRPWRFYKQDC